MQDGEWKRWERRLAAAMMEERLSLAAARRLYEEVSDERLDEATIERLVAAAWNAWIDSPSPQSRHGAGAGRTGGRYGTAERSVSHHVVGWIAPIRTAGVMPTTRIVRTPSDVMVVVDSQMIGERDVTRAMQTVGMSDVVRVGSSDQGPGSVCIDSHVDAGRAWVVDTSQATLRELVASAPVNRARDRRAG